jgi:histidine triad (HIT) family protein
MSPKFEGTCPFCAILAGTEPAAFIARDDGRGLALIQSRHPESSIHWLAIPSEHHDRNSELQSSNPDRMSELLNFAVNQARARAPEFPALASGFTVKIHFGAYETTPHAKLHLVAVE